MTARLAVVGDALLDRDWNGVAARFSPDGPVPVLDQLDEQTRPGGAGFTAVAAAGDAPVVLVTALADDASGAELRRLLAFSGVDVLDLRLAGPTPEKVRVRAGGQTVARVDRNGAAAAVGAMTAAATAALEEANAVIVADYGRGVAASSTVRRVLRRVAADRPVVWDPHRLGPRPVSGTDLATPNIDEARAAAGSRRTGGDVTVVELAALAEEVRRRWRCPVAVTAGPVGAMLADASGAVQLVTTIAATGDACGAGDHLAAGYAWARAHGASRAEALQLGVDRATTHVAAPALRSLAVPTGSEADVVVAAVRRGGGTIVAAGGCFDILHPGHVSLLERARALGDCLVVCVNDDRSVRRLKGPGRPVNRAADRAAVLRGLRCVDAVDVFSDDTPVPLLTRLQPDLFVKGGDYDGVELPEAAAMAAWGGRVVLLPTVRDRSTSRIIARASMSVSA